MPRRGFLRVAGASVAGAILSGCGAPGGSRVIELGLTSGDPVTVAQPLIGQFEASHPGVRVHLAPTSTGSSTAMEAAIVAGAAPDVFWGTDPTLLLSNALCLNLAPLTTPTELADFSSAQLAAFRSGSGLYMLPQSNTPAAYVVRQDVFTNQGVALPDASWTSDDLARVWLALRIPGQRVGGRLPWTPTSTFYFNGWGGSLVTPGNTMRCALNSSPAIACGQWMWDRFWQDQSAAGPQGQATWATIQNGSLLMEVATSADVARYAASASYPWTVLPFPRWPARLATSTTTPFYAIPVTTTHRDLAWELLQFVTSTKWEQTSLQTGVSPARKSQWPAFIAFVRGEAPVLKDLPLEAAFTTAVLDDWAYPTQTFRFQSAAMGILDKTWSTLFGTGGKESIATGFAQAATAVDTAQAAAERQSS